MNAKAWDEMTADERKYVEDVERRIARATRQMELQRIASRRNVKCFKCGSSLNAWAKVVDDKRAWGICLPCVRAPKAAA